MLLGHIFGPCLGSRNGLFGITLDLLASLYLGPEFLFGPGPCFAFSIGFFLRLESGRGFRFGLRLGRSPCLGLRLDLSLSL